MSTTTQLIDKAGTAGAIVGGFGCAACFPALASIGAAIGLGFLGQWEGVLVRFLIPGFVLAVLFANVAGSLANHQWPRAALGSVGPILALIGAFGLMGVFAMTPGFLAANLARGTFYTGLVVMLGVASWDLIHPGSRNCRADRPGARGGTP